LSMGESSLIPAVTVVQHRQRIPRQTERPAFTPGGRVADRTDLG
jgi:hypothetical protein